MKIINVHLKLTGCEMLICWVSIALNAPSCPILIPILQMKKLSLKAIADFPKAHMMRRLGGELCMQTKTPHSNSQPSYCHHLSIREVYSLAGGKKTHRYLVTLPKVKWDFEES